MLLQRALGTSGLSVSIMSLGSWRSFERISHDDGIAVMRAAQDAGITFLDDARYDDETGTAPIRTGYSEIVFGELFRGAGWARDEVVVANKLWWEHWPQESAQAELDGSLRRMGLDHVDVIYAIATATPPVEVVVEQVAGLLSSGRARAWGTGMWSGSELTEALDICDATGTPYPVVAQMACSLADHRQSGDPGILAALDRGGIGLVAAHVLAGGTLSGKYLDPGPGGVTGAGTTAGTGTGTGMNGRAGSDDSPATARGKHLARPLAALAASWGVPTAHLALASALDHPNLASVLFGATTPAQVRENVAAVDTWQALSAEQHAAVEALAGEP